MTEETTPNEAETIVEEVTEQAETPTVAEETTPISAEAPAAEAEAEPAEAPTAEAPAAEVEAEPAEAPAAPVEASGKRLSLNDLKPGMSFEGRVKSVELYGAFVDIGVGKDALLHISQLGKANVKNVEDVVKAGETITVFVLKVDPQAERIALSTERPPERPMGELRVGDIVTGKVVRIESFGAFIDIGAERPGMIHVSELATGFVQSPDDVVKLEEEVTARVIKVNRKKRQIDLSIKALEEEKQQEAMAEINEDNDEPMPTAMELALRRAMETATDGESTAKADKRQRNSTKKKQALEDVLSRTLKQHDN